MGAIGTIAGILTRIPFRVSAGAIAQTVDKVLSRDDIQIEMKDVPKTTMEITKALARDPVVQRITDTGSWWLSLTTWIKIVSLAGPALTIVVGHEITDQTIETLAVIGFGAGNLISFVLAWVSRRRAMRALAH